MSSKNHIDDDDRFKHIATDPRFRRMRKDEQKIKIDNRFKGMFKDKRFLDQVNIDKRGRPVEQRNNNDLKRYYRVSESEDDEDVDDDDGDRLSGEPDLARGEGADTSSSSDEDEEEDEEEVKEKKASVKIGVESEDDGEDVEADDESDTIDLSQAWGELDHDAETGEETSRRLALCNMDWDRIKAVDILVLCNSFVPKEGTIESVSILPSEFGKERMKQEDFSGPLELRKASVENQANGVDDADDDADDEAAQQRKLRQYQLNRLKYYYAVITCNSIATAEKVYADLDGHDYESSGTKVDLRFIPDDMTFDDEPKDVCTALPSADSVYEPEAFVTKALHQSKVECTWDETDRERTRVTRRKFDKEELEALDLKDYLASSSSEDEDGADDEGEEKGMSNESRIALYRKLLEGIESKEDGEKKKKLKAGELQVTFEPGLKEKAEKLVQEKLTEKTDLTPFEEMKKKAKDKKKGKLTEKETRTSDDDDDIPDGIDLNDPYFAEELAEINGGKTKPGTSQDDANKKKKKKKKKKAETAPTEEEAKDAEELRLLLSDDEDGDRKHFNMKKIVKKETMSKKQQKKLEKEGKKKKEDNFDIDLNDSRFAALNTDPNFNIDQSNPNFKRTKSSVALLNNKLKKRGAEDDVILDGALKRKKKKKNRAN